ncbi:MAG: pectin esterase [Phycisphaerales bacterium]|nr:pectin esterase [Phycisphaerales bacterium]
MKSVKLACALVTLFAATTLAEDAKPITVAATGGDFATVQAAIDSIPKGDKDSHILIIKPGTYKEKIKISKGQTHITLKGDGEKPADTVLSFDDWAQRKDKDGKDIGTRGSASVAIEGSDITCENLTFENTAGDVGQAVALRTQGDKFIFRNCRMTGWQDTLYANDGRAYYENCYIEGRTDFIFGRAVAVFDHCELRSKNGGFVTAASTNEKDPFGYVFLDCKLTHDPKPFKGPGGNVPVPTSLGRPWRPMASVTFIRCTMGPHIKPEGWSEWKGDDGKPKPARYSEFASTGPGGNVSKRVDWSKQLTKAEADAITVESVLAGKDGWNPKAK